MSGELMSGGANIRGTNVLVGAIVLGGSNVLVRANVLVGTYVMGRTLCPSETLNLTHFSNFAVILMPSCNQTFRIGLDLTCSSSGGLNFEDFPCFYFLNLRNLLCGKSLNGANSASRSPIEEGKK